MRCSDNISIGVSAPFPSMNDVLCGSFRFFEQTSICLLRVVARRAMRCGVMWMLWHDVLNVRATPRVLLVHVRCRDAARVFDKHQGPPPQLWLHLPSNAETGSTARPEATIVWRLDEGSNKTVCRPVCSKRFCPFAQNLPRPSLPLRERCPPNQRPRRELWWQRKMPRPKGQRNRKRVRVLPQMQQKVLFADAESADGSGLHMGTP